MKTRAHKQDSRLIVYDADTIQHAGAFLFDPEYWMEQGGITGEAEGRGRALFLETEFGQAVLRQYLRGGWAARASRDRYVFNGFDKSRPVLEFAILEQLSALGLPAPQPLAAMCVRDGAFYKGWLLMRMIPAATPLAEVIPSRQGAPELWRGVGVCIRRFHDHGLIHADLNARNILVGEANEIHLIDFDRARLRENDSRAFSSNLRRLHRSLQKVWPRPHRGHLESCWTLLLAGYDSKKVTS